MYKLVKTAIFQLRPHLKFPFQISHSLPIHELGHQEEAPDAPPFDFRAVVEAGFMVPCFFSACRTCIYSISEFYIYIYILINIYIYIYINYDIYIYTMHL